MKDNFNNLIMCMKICLFLSECLSHVESEGQGRGLCHVLGNVFHWLYSLLLIFSVTIGPPSFYSMPSGTVFIEIRLQDSF